MKILVIIDRYTTEGAHGADYFCNDLIKILKERHEVSIVARGGEKTKITLSEHLLLMGETLAEEEAEVRKFVLSHVSPKGFDLIYNLGGLVFASYVVKHLIQQYETLPLVNHFQILLQPFLETEGMSGIQDFHSVTQQVACEHGVMNIFISHTEYQFAAKAGYRMGQAINTIIPNGVDYRSLEKIKPEYELLPPALQVPEKRPLVIGTVGRFADRIKGGDLVYRAFSTLWQDTQDIHLLAIRKGTRYQHILDVLPSHAYTLMDFMPRDQFYRILKMVDVLVLPSRYEAFGLITVEAMMMGIPVVVNAVGGLQEIVWHNHTGLISEPESGSLGLYFALKSLTNDREKLRKMGVAGHEHAKAEYNLDRIAKLVEKSLERARLVFQATSRVLVS